MKVDCKTLLHIVHGSKNSTEIKQKDVESLVPVILKQLDEDEMDIRDSILLSVPMLQ